MACGLPISPLLHRELRDGDDKAIQAFMTNSRGLVSQTRMNRVIALHVSVATELGVLHPSIAQSVQIFDDAVANGESPQAAWSRVVGAHACFYVQSHP